MGRQTVIVSDRGQITLPKALRERLAIKPGSALIVEQDEGRIVLRPAAVTPVEIYTDEEIAAWVEEDQIDPKKRKAILKKKARSS